MSHALREVAKIAVFCTVFPIAICLFSFGLSLDSFFAGCVLALLALLFFIHEVVDAELQRFRRIEDVAVEAYNALSCLNGDSVADPEAVSLSVSEALQSLDIVIAIARRSE